MITSRHNPRIKEIRRLNAAAKNRHQAGLFPAEGVRLLEEVLQAGWVPEWVIYSKDLDPRGMKLVEEFKALSVQCEPVTAEVLQAASDTESPQGILALLPLKALPLPASPRLILILDAIRDPGNLGTLMRTCLAAGVDGLLLGPGTVDPYTPKVIRAAMGAHFKLPLISGSWEEIRTLVNGMPLYLAEMNEGQSVWEANLAQPLGIILGGEAHGPGKEARALADRALHIPMAPGVESLNAAVAGAVLLFEVYRQRQKANPD